MGLFDGAALGTVAFEVAAGRHRHRRRRPGRNAVIVGPRIINDGFHYIVEQSPYAAPSTLTS